VKFESLLEVFRMPWEQSSLGDPLMEIRAIIWRLGLLLEYAWWDTLS